MQDRNLIKLTYKEANHPDFMNGLRRIVGTPMNLKVCYQFKKILDDVEKLKRKMADEYEKEILEKFVKKDEKGNKIFDANNEAYKVDEKDKAEFEKLIKEFETRTATLEREKVSLAFLSNFHITLTPGELDGMMPVLEDDMEPKVKKKASA